MDSALGAESLKLMPLFKRLKTLDFSDGYIKWSRNASVNARDVRLFDFRSCWTDFMTFQSSNLENVYLKFIPNLSNADMKKMLQSHPTMKSLSIIDCSRISSDIFDAIGQLKKLEEFEFQQNWQRSEQDFQHDLNHLALLQNLKVLKLNCNKYSVSNLLAKLVGLTDLEPANGPIDSKTVESITKHKSLTVLKFKEMTDVTDSCIWAIGNELKLLTEFHIKTNEFISIYTINALVRVAHRLQCSKIDIPSYTLTESTYNTLLNHVQNRKNHIPLEFTIYSKDGHQVSQEVQERMGPNKQWLRIHELNRALLFELFPNNATMDDDDDFIDDDSDVFLI